MFGAILKPTNRSFQKGMTFCRSVYVKKVMKLLAFIFEQPSYNFCLHRFYQNLLSKLRSAGLNYNSPSFFTESYCAAGI